MANIATAQSRVWQLAISRSVAVVVLENCSQIMNLAA